MDARRHTVFVYGSLLRGLGNHGILARAERRGAALFIGESTTDERFAMVSFGAFPGLIADGPNPERITGEAWRVDDSTLRELDRLEGNGHFYTRQTITLDDDSIVAWCYLLPKRFLDHPPVTGGSWRDFVMATRVAPSAVAYDDGEESDDDEFESNAPPMTDAEWNAFFGTSDDDDDDDDPSDPFFVRGEG